MQYSRISELELIKGRARGKAIESLAQERVPDRMWGRVQEDEVNQRLQTGELGKIVAGIDSLRASLEGLGVFASTKPERGRESLDLARAIMSLVYFDVPDGIIYASAIVAQADYVIASDGYLVKSINKIQNPSNQQNWVSIQKQLIEFVSSITVIGRGSVLLPKGLTPTRNKLQSAS